MCVRTYVYALYVQVMTTPLCLLACVHARTYLCVVQRAIPVVVLQGVKVGQVRELSSRAPVKTPPPMGWERCVRRSLPLPWVGRGVCERVPLPPMGWERGMCERVPPPPMGWERCV